MSQGLCITQFNALKRLTTEHRSFLPLKCDAIWSGRELTVFRGNVLSPFSEYKIKVAHSSKTPVSVYKSTQHYISEEANICNDILSSLPHSEENICPQITTATTNLQNLTILKTIEVHMVKLYNLLPHHSVCGQTDSTLPTNKMVILLNYLP